MGWGGGAFMCQRIAGPRVDKYCIMDILYLYFIHMNSINKHLQYTVLYLQLVLIITRADFAIAFTFKGTLSQGFETLFLISNTSLLVPLKGQGHEILFG